LTRAEARDRAAKEAADALAAEVANRRRLRDEQERFSSILAPLVLLASALWVGLVFYTNVRERRGEIGILRALGARAATILRLFLTKALLMGCAGGLAGYLLGTSIGLAGPGGGGSSVLDLRIFLVVFCTAVVLSAGASWVPAYYAAQQEPAEVLREE
ncbi:MAG: FtsX-like permease family protein, partial [Acidobacteria bacterium]|nr:FtsX-like permease family protein [Acidobacteriota bacterium]